MQQRASTSAEEKLLQQQQQQNEVESLKQQICEVRDLGATTYAELVVFILLRRWRRPLLLLLCGLRSSVTTASRLLGELLRVLLPLAI